jgi:hypothetical protein
MDIWSPPRFHGRVADVGVHRERALTVAGLAAHRMLALALVRRPAGAWTIFAQAPHGAMS